MKTEPQKEHQWLQQLRGDWTYEAEMQMGPDQPPTKSRGQESVRTLGGLWLLCDGSGTMPGLEGIGTTLMTLGYDTQKQAFVGSWVGSMMANMWIYRGQLDPAQKVLTLDTEGPSFAGDGKLARYQDVITLKNSQERELSSQVLQGDGTWKRFMTARYRRVK